MGEKVTGYIDHVIFRNEENGYTPYSHRMKMLSAKGHD